MGYDWAKFLMDCFNVCFQIDFEVVLPTENSKDKTFKVSKYNIFINV